MSTFLQAAASYFGINPDIINKSEMYTAEDGGQRLVIEIKVSDADVLGVADRMKVVREVVPVDPEQGHPMVGAIGAIDGKEVGVWLRRREVHPRQPIAANTFDGNLALVRFEDLTEHQKLGRPGPLGMDENLRLTGLTRDELKAQWQSLSKDEQAKYNGSWHNYLAAMRDD